MFFWLVAIPFFLIIAMFTIFRLPGNDLKETEEAQDSAMAFRMMIQHDATAKVIEDYIALRAPLFDSTNENYNETLNTALSQGAYNIEGDDGKDILRISGHISDSFVMDTDNISTYIRCLDAYRELVNCRTAESIYVMTAATPPSASAQTNRWFETVGATNLAEQLKKYQGNFPSRQKGMAIPVKPVKREDESDADFAIRLNTYETNKAEYVRIKRRNYEFLDQTPITTVGEVRPYPFDGEEEGDKRVIVKRIRSTGGVANYEVAGMPTDIPDAEGVAFDFNGEAVIYTVAGVCGDVPYTPQEIIEGCNANPTMLNNFCQLGLRCKINDSCDNVNRTYPTIATGTQVYLTTDSETDPYSVNIIKPGDKIEWTNISTSTMTNPVEQIGDSFTVTCPGRYRVTLMGEGGSQDGDYSSIYSGPGGILIATGDLLSEETLNFKSILGGKYTSTFFGGAGICMWKNDVVNLCAGGGGVSYPAISSSIRSCGGGGYLGGGNFASWSGGGSSGVNTTLYGYSHSGSIVLPPNGLYSTVLGYGGTVQYDVSCVGDSDGSGGTSFCFSSSFNCTETGGGLSNPGGSRGISSTGNRGKAYVSIEYLGAITPSESRTVLEVTNINTDTCTSYSETSHSCVGSGSWLTNVKTLETFIIPISGYYKVTIAGAYGVPSTDQHLSGGIAQGNRYFSEGESLVIKIVPGGRRTADGEMGGAGVLLRYSSNDSLLLGAGGGATGTSGGGGIVGGNAQNESYSAYYALGMGYNGSLGGNSVPSSTTTDNAQGGAWLSGMSNQYGYGGTGSTTADCTTAGFTSCLIVSGGNTGTAYPYNAFGNFRKGYLRIHYCGDSVSDCP